jgi:hypothetical protein
MYQACDGACHLLIVRFCCIVTQNNCTILTIAAIALSRLLQERKGSSVLPLNTHIVLYCGGPFAVSLSLTLTLMFFGPYFLVSQHSIELLEN